MKKIIMILLLGMTFSLAACGKETGAENVEEVIAEAEPMEEPTPEPVEEPTPEPEEETTPEPVEEPTPEPEEKTTPEPAEEPMPEPTEAPTPEPVKETESYLSPSEAVYLKPISFGSTDEEVQAKISKVLSCSNESAAEIMESCAMYGIDFTQMTLCAFQKINGSIFFYVSTAESNAARISINPEVEPYYVYHVNY